jgi:hypothetical protein
MSAKPTPPAGLGTPGKHLWKAILADLAPGWSLDARELHLLGEAARCADRLGELDAVVERDGLLVTGSTGQPRLHPAVAEARQTRLAQARLIDALELEDPALARARLTPASRRAAEAAESRWSRTRRAESA